MIITAVVQLWFNLILRNKLPASKLPTRMLFTNEQTADLRRRLKTIDLEDFVAL